VISQCHDPYLRALIAYRSILRKRNAVLQQYSYYGKSVLKGFDEQLIVNGAQVMRMRNETLVHLNGVISAFYENSSKEVSVDLVYQPDILRRDDDFKVDQLHDVFQERLSERLSTDIERGITQSGPHRDNYDLRLNGRSLCKYGSEGQCRFMALALRFAAHELLVRHARDNCAIVFLIDDVLGELDDKTRAMVLKKVLKQQQAVIACTRIPVEIEKNATAVYQIESGAVYQW
jgi:DNA replication and repair protein RecF